MKSHSLLICLMASFILSACHSAETEILKATGLQVVYQNDAKADPCVQQQIDALMSEYDAMSDSEKSALKNQVSQSTIRQLVLSPSRVAGEMTGDYTALALVMVTHGRNGSKERIVDQKTFQDNRTVDVQPGLTEVEKTSSSVTLTPSAAAQNSIEHYYSTISEGLYKKLNSVEQINEHIASEKIKFLSSLTDGGDLKDTQPKCGPSVSIKEILAQ